MKKFKILILLGILSLFTSCATSREKQENRAKEITKQVNRLVSDQTLWPDFKIQEHPIWLVSLDEKLIHLYHRGTLRQLNFESQKKHLPQTKFSYTFEKINNQQTLLINTKGSGSTKEMADTLIHEAFHIFYQKDWVTSKNNSHGELYPIDGSPRYYRFEMIRNLEHFLTTQNKKYLQAYSFWFKRWSTLFPFELKNFIDRIEGSAQYYSMGLWGLIKPQKSPVGLYKSHLHKKGDIHRDLFGLNSEAYYLGYLAGHALDKISPNKKWQHQVKTKFSPTSLLAKKFQPVRQSIDIELQKKYQIIAVEKMREIDKDGKLDSEIKKLATPKSIRLVFQSQSYRTTPMMISGFYRSFFNFEGLNNVTFYQLAGSLQLKGKTFNYSFKTNDIWIKARKTPCSKKLATVISLQPSAIKSLNEGQLLLSQEPKITIKYKEIKKGQTRWLCVL